MTGVRKVPKLPVAELNKIPKAVNTLAGQTVFCPVFCTSIFSSETLKSVANLT